MKKDSIGFAAVLLAACCFLSLGGVAQSNDSVTIKGTVRPLTNDEGDVVGTYIETRDADYLVADTATGRELMDHIDKVVEVTGRISSESEEEEEEEENERQTITVESYRVIDTSPSTAPDLG